MLKKPSNIPLCVDLDGTLIFSDTLIELLSRAIKISPLILLLLPFWLMKGRVNLKMQLAKRFSTYVNNLPFNEVLVDFLKREKNGGRKIYLVTACEENLAKKIAKKVGIFDDVWGTDEHLNLKGTAKANFLIGKFGEKNFIYAGNDTADIPVWRASAEMVLVNASRSVKNTAVRENPQKPFLVFDKQKTSFVFLRTIRIHQWAKNFLIFIPLLLSHNFTNTGKILNCIAAFVAFGLCASATYIINDLLDIENDRSHHEKRFRPIPAGNIGFVACVATIGVFFALAAFFAFSIDMRLMLMLLAYIIITLCYSFCLKKLIIVDIIALAFFYIFRLYFGAVAVDVPISHWFITFATFIFLSLGAVKRYTEILKTKESSREKLSGRGYTVDDISIISNIGVSAGLISVLTYIIYINYGANEYYRNPAVLLWGSFPLLYFILKIWIKASRNEVQDDPIVYAIKTKENYLLFFIILLIFIIAKPVSG